MHELFMKQCAFVLCMNQVLEMMQLCICEFLEMHQVLMHELFGNNGAQNSNASIMKHNIVMHHVEKQAFLTQD
jgi:hypothetical protein